VHIKANPFKDQLLDSERLKFRKLDNKDAERLYLIYSDKIAMKYRGSNPVLDLSGAYEMITKQVNNKNNFDSYRLGVIEKTENLLIGTLLLKYDTKFQNQCEIGFSFDKSHWNKGYRKEIINMLVNSFNKLKHLKELRAWCKKENIASMKILEKTGFCKKTQNEYPESYLYILNMNIK